jgi:hypothetical protein
LTRVKELIEQVDPLFEEVQVAWPKWTEWVKDARNSVAHRKSGMAPIEKQWQTAHVATLAVEWLLVAILMKDLGFTDDQIRGRFGRNYSWNLLPERLERWSVG